MLRRREVLAFGLAVPVLRSRRALGQSRYPERPIRLVIPYPPGGVYDATGRPWAERARALLGPIVIENMGGAGSSLGTAAVVRAQPDGYTILLAGTSGLVINPLAATSAAYDPVHDLAPIAILGLNPTAINVHPGLPIRSIAELIAYAKANPGKLSYGSSGVGTVNHLVGELLKARAGIEIAHVPYRGAGPAMTDLISGHIPMLLQSVTAQVVELHHADKLRMLAVTGTKRLAAAPEVPTVVEAGRPELVAQQFIGLFAPRGTPAAIIAQIADVTRMVMADDELKRNFAASGFEPELASSPDEARDLLRAEIARWTPIIRAIGLRLD